MDSDGTKDYAYSNSRFENATSSYPFLIGSGIPDYEDIAGTTTDEIYIWHKTLSPLEIWHFYLQGGTVAWAVGSYPTMTIHVPIEAN